MNAADAQRQGYVPPRPGAPRFGNGRPAKFVEPVSATARSAREALNGQHANAPNGQFANAPNGHYANAVVDWSSAQLRAIRDAQYVNIDSLESPPSAEAASGFPTHYTILPIGSPPVQQNGAAGGARLNVDRLASAQAAQARPLPSPPAGQ